MERGFSGTPKQAVRNIRCENRSDDFPAFFAKLNAISGSIRKNQLALMSVMTTGASRSLGLTVIRCRVKKRSARKAGILRWYASSG